jgi:outer membrane protein TolC
MTRVTSPGDSSHCAIQGRSGSFLNVLVLQTVYLNEQQGAVNFRTQQMVASVQLIKALGGGWSASQVPAPGDLPREISRAGPR